MYVLKKNTSSHAVYPYYMDDVEGDRPMSSIDLAQCSGSHEHGLTMFNMAL